MALAGYINLFLEVCIDQQSTIEHIKSADQRLLAHK